MHQGDIKSECFFSIRYNKVFQNLHGRIAVYGGGTAIVDDTCIMGPPEKIFIINKMFAEDLDDAGLQLQLAKSQYYIAEDFRNEEWEEY